MNVSFLIRLIDQVTEPAQRMAAALRKVSPSAKSIDKAFERAANIKQAAEGLNSLSSRAAGLVTKPLHEFEQFEEAMARVKAQTGASGEAFEHLSNSARQLAMGGRFSAAEVAGAMEGLAVEGLNVNDIMSSMPTIINAATASNESLGTVIGQTTGLMDAFGLSADQMANVTDIITASAKAGGTSIGNMRQALEASGRAAKTAGVSVERTATMAGLLAKANVDGGRAGGVLSMVMKNLTRPMGEGADALKYFGVSTTTTVNGVKKLRDPLETLLELQKKSAGNPLQSRAFFALFRDAAPDVQALIRAANEDGGLQGMMDAIGNSGGATKAMAGVINDTDADATRKLNAAWADLSLTAGKELAPAALTLVQTLTGGVKAIGAFARENPKLVQGLMLGVGGVAVVGKTAATAMSIFGSFFSIFGTVGSGMRTMAMALFKLGPALKGIVTFAGQVGPKILAMGGPFLAVAAAIGAVTLAITELVKHWDELNFGEAWKGVKDVFGDEGALGVAKQLFDPSALLKDVGLMGDAAPEVPLGPAAPGLAKAGNTQVGGKLDIRVTSDGKAQVTSVEQHGPMDLDVNAGLAAGY